MGGDLAAITAALTRTPTPDSRGRPAASAGSPSGNAVAPSGQNLPVSSPPPPPLVVDVKRAVERLNQLMTSHQCSLRFEIDASSGRTVITVVNDATKEVVRQIPSPELLRIARNLDDLGSLIDARA